MWTAPYHALPADDRRPELLRYGDVLFLSCTVYLLLSGSFTFVPATIMKAVSEEMGMSISYLGNLNAAGPGVKAAMVMFFMGPVLDTMGPPLVINGCLIGSAITCFGLAVCTDPMAYTAVFLANSVFNAFGEQPAFIVLFATYFHEQLGVASTLVSSANSVAGFVLPLILSPVLVTFGFRALWVILGLISFAVVPISLWKVRFGPISLKSNGAAPTPTVERVHLSLGTGASAVGFAIRMKLLLQGKKESQLTAEERLDETSGVSGGVLTQHRGCLVHAESTLHVLGRSYSSLTSPSKTPAKLSSQAQALASGATAPSAVLMDLTLADAARTVKFWALLAACFTFLIYGGMLNTLLPTILIEEAGMSATQAAQMYSVYNITGVLGKVLTAVFFSVPFLRKSFWLYIPFPFMYWVSHLCILDVSLPALAGGEVLQAFSVTTDETRILGWCSLSGLGYGFGAAITAVFVKEFFGLTHLSKIQPIQYGCNIFGSIFGMFLPGMLYRAYGAYTASLLLTLATTTITFGCFVVMNFSHPIGED